MRGSPEIMCVPQAPTVAGIDPAGDVGTNHTRFADRYMAWDFPGASPLREFESDPTPALRYRTAAAGGERVRQISSSRDLTPARVREV